LLVLRQRPILVTVFFAKHELEQIETSQQRLADKMAPRAEVELQLVPVKADLARIAVDQIDLRARNHKLRTGGARLTAKP